jgi:hypothetical protein
MSLLPIPTAETPAWNQPSIFSLVVSTPPVGINNNFGKISFIPQEIRSSMLPEKFDKMNSVFSASMISVGVIQPGLYKIRFFKNLPTGTVD